VTDLKLIALPTSPFAARVQIQILHKGLDVQVEHPEPGVSPGQHGASNPFAKTPILLHAGTQIIESAAIAEYLEDIFPEPGLRGHSAVSNAHIRAFVRAVDLYLFPLMFRLRALAPNDQGLESLLVELHQVLTQLEALCDGQAYICGDQLSLADCALVPAVFYLDLFLGRHQQPDFRLQHPVLANWWKTANSHDSVQKVIAALQKALQALR
jgi:glutathione S-transferase